MINNSIASSSSRIQSSPLNKQIFSKSVVSWAQIQHQEWLVSCLKIKALRYKTYIFLLNIGIANSTDYHVTLQK